MPVKRKKAIALLTTAAGLGIVIPATVALYRPLQEQYWIWQLENGSNAQRIGALEQLAELRPLRAIPALVEAADRAISNSPHSWVVNEWNSELAPRSYVRDPTRREHRPGNYEPGQCMDVLRRIVFKHPVRADRALRPYLKDKRETVRAIVVCVFFKGTRRAEDYVPGLIYSVPAASPGSR